MLGEREGVQAIKSKTEVLSRLFFSAFQSLACRWLPSLYVLSSLSSVCIHPGISLCVQISCSYKDISQIELGSTIITSLNLTTPSKAPSPSAGHVCLPCASVLLSWEVTDVCRCCYWDESLLQRGLILFHRILM